MGRNARARLVTPWMYMTGVVYEGEKSGSLKGSGGRLRAALAAPSAAEPATIMVASFMRIQHMLSLIHI